MTPLKYKSYLNSRINYNRKRLISNIFSALHSFFPGFIFSGWTSAVQPGLLAKISLVRPGYSQSTKANLLARAVNDSPEILSECGSLRYLPSLCFSIQQKSLSALLFFTLLVKVTVSFKRKENHYHRFEDLIISPDQAQEKAGHGSILHADTGQVSHGNFLL